MITILRNMAVYMGMKCRMLLSDEKGEVNVVAIVVLIGVAVLLAIIFRDAIADLLNGLFSKIGESSGNAIKEGSVSYDGGN